MSAAVLLLSSLPLAILGDAGVFGAYPLHGGNHMKQQIALNSDISINNIDTLSTRCEYTEDGAFPATSRWRSTRASSTGR